MRCLSVQQPRAHLIVTGLKPLENRDWTTNHRGPLLIHAGQRFDSYALAWLETILDAETFAKLPKHAAGYERGGIVGIARLAKVVRHSESVWFQGPYGWCFDWARPVQFFELKGALGLFEPHPAVLATIRREFEERKAKVSA